MLDAAPGGIRLRSWTHGTGGHGIAARIDTTGSHDPSAVADRRPAHIRLHSDGNLDRDVEAPSENGDDKVGTVLGTGGSDFLPSYRNYAEFRGETCAAGLTNPPVSYHESG